MVWAWFGHAAPGGGVAETAAADADADTTATAGLIVAPSLRGQLAAVLPRNPCGKPPATRHARPTTAPIYLSASPLPVSALLCLVVAISDGDTLTARCGTPGAYQQVTVRIAAIDAPERKQAFGQRARQHLAQLCFRQRATLRPLARDAYGRTVANVRCGRTDVAAAQVGAGMAWVYTPYASAHPHLARLQQQARASRKGLWAQPRPLAPWSYRQRHQR